MTGNVARRRRAKRIIFLYHEEHKVLFYGKRRYLSTACRTIDFDVKKARTISLVIFLRFFDSQQRDQHIGRKVCFGQVNFVELLVLSAFAQTLPLLVALFVLDDKIVEQFCVQQIFARGV